MMETELHACPICGRDDCACDAVDTPDVEDVLQDTDPNVPAVPVRVVNQSQTDVLPSTLGAARSIVVPGSSLAAGAAIRVLGSDPRRKRVTLIAYNQDVCLAGTQSEADAFTGAVLPSGTAGTLLPVPLVLEVTSELWARPVTTTGTVRSSSTTASLLSMFVEQWSR